MSVLRSRGHQIYLSFNPNTSKVEHLFERSWKLTRKHKIPEKKLDTLSYLQLQRDLGPLAVLFIHPPIAYNCNWMIINGLHFREDAPGVGWRAGWRFYGLDKALFKTWLLLLFCLSSWYVFNPKDCVFGLSSSCWIMLSP